MSNLKSVLLSRWSNTPGAVLLILAASWNASAYAAPPNIPTPNVVVQWDNAALQAIRDLHPGPPMAARMLAITHTCMFDAWAAYSKNAVGTQLGSSLRRPASERSWPIKIRPSAMQLIVP